jgi:hypothetical protein
MGPSDYHTGLVQNANFNTKIGQHVSIEEKENREREQELSKTNQLATHSYLQWSGHRSHNHEKILILDFFFKYVSPYPKIHKKQILTTLYSLRPKK